MEEDSIDDDKIFPEEDDSDDEIGKFCELFVEANLSGAPSGKIKKKKTKEFHPESLLEGLEDYSEFK
jgi:hypothetical protein